VQRADLMARRTHHRRGHHRLLLGDGAGPVTIITFTCGFCGHKVGPFLAAVDTWVFRVERNGFICVRHEVSV
jgi:hypothetical protein